MDSEEEYEMRKQMKTGGWSQREEKAYMGQEDTVQEKYDEPQEVRQAIERTPTTKELATGGGGIGGWIKKAFIKSDEEVAIEQEAKAEYQKTYLNERRSYKLEEARKKARGAAREPYWGGGLARALKSGFNEVRPSKKRFKGKKKYKTQYVVQNGVAYPVHAPRTSVIARKERLGNQKVTVDRFIYGNAQARSGGRDLNDILMGGSTYPSKKKRKGNALDMLGNLI